VDTACADAGRLRSLRVTTVARDACVRPSSRKLKPRPADLPGSRVRVLDIPLNETCFSTRGPEGK